MRLAISASPAKVRSSPSQVWDWTLGGLAAAGVVVAAVTLAHDRLSHHGTAPAVEAKTDEPAASEKKPTHDPTRTVVLPEGKFKQADIRVEPVTLVDMPKEVGVTGQIEADPNRRVDIRARASGVVRTTPVLPGTKVKKGDALVVLDSPDVGSARLLVRERQRALATVRVEAAWKAESAANTEAMIEQLRRGVGAQELAREFAGKRMGNTRGALLTAYSELEIAAHEQEKQAGLRGVTGEHLLFLAQHNREAAQARFDGALEQVRFDVSQQDRIARQSVRNAEEMVVDAAQRLKILGVAEDIGDLLAHPERASALPPGSEDVAAYPILAPFDGTIVSTSTVISQRVEPTDTLFVLADLSKVYAVANIDESRFGILPGLGGGKVHLSASAYPGRQFDSRMLYTGAEVNPVTRIVRLVSETDNPDGLLKLGMFVNIVLDTAATEKATTVPVGSVVEVDGKSAVFVPGEGERRFDIRPVKLGREALGRQVVTDGLKPGDRVVVAGAFVLKSELLLQQEKEEE